MQNKKGNLIVFTSYAPGAGKTYAMLSYAVKLCEEGKSVHIGYLNHSFRKDINRLADKVGRYKRGEDSTHIGILDIKQIIDKKPEYCVVDELMFVNINSQKFFYQEIEYLLEAGICVLASVSMLRLAKVNDQCSRISGVRAKSTLPDEVFQSASKVVFINPEINKVVSRYRDNDLFVFSTKTWKKYIAKDNLVRYRECSLQYLKEMHGVNYEIIDG